MSRRAFLTAAGIAGFFALGGAATYFNLQKGTPATSHGSTSVAYAPGVVKELLAANKTVFVDVYTSWCSTCTSQGRTIEVLRQENPAYDANMVFVALDWDVYANSDFARKYRIQNRSTLLILRGNKVLAGSYADTRYSGIKALMDVGLAKG